MNDFKYKHFDYTVCVVVVMEIVFTVLFTSTSIELTFVCILRYYNLILVHWSKVMMNKEINFGLSQETGFRGKTIAT